MRRLPRSIGVVVRAVGVPWLCAFALLVACAGTLRAEPAETGSEAFFERNVRPVLAGTCFRCHGGDKVSGGLRVDSREALLGGGDSGPAVVPGDADGSLLIRAVRRLDDASAMPPESTLPDQQVEHLAAWVKAGAPWPAEAPKFTAARHWSLEPVKQITPPSVVDSNWPQTSVDRFVLAKLEAAGVHPSPPTDRRALLRRVSYDLTGLPPTAAEVAAFESDPSPDAFTKVIERLLASPRYGEHWGRHWLDVVRYADTAGENTDHPLPHAWRYRNWVIGALNSDLPYDEFVRQQVAGDLLAATGPPDDYANRVVATGFLAIARRFGHDIDKDVHLTYEDALDTLGKSVLGLSIGCCRCHDHKYDPLTARDYYGLYGILASTRLAFPGCEPSQQPRDLVPLTPPTEGAPSAAASGDQLAAAGADDNASDASKAGNNASTDTSSAPVVELAYAVSEGTPTNARIHLRGDPATLGDEVPRKFPDVLGGQTLQNPQASGRLELADWLTDRANPLTARVVVNRVWQWHFGTGLVKTPNDFGLRGAAPTHPELLDHLAVEFMASGWRLKHLHRLILHSATYQQRATNHDSPAAAQYAAFGRRRLSAEELRDTLLALSGELDIVPGEAHPFPAEGTWKFTQHMPFAAEYETAKRSVYVMQKRNRRTRFFALFDGADPNASTPVRDLTTVPTQALFFLNDPFLHARADKCAELVLAAAADDAGRLEFATRRFFGRAATADERAEAGEFLETYEMALTELPTAERPDAEKHRAAWQALVRVLLSSNELLHVE